MRLNDEEIKALTDLHGRSRDLTFQLGVLDLRMADMRAQWSSLSHQAQGKIAALAGRLGIPPGTAGQMLPDGSVVLLDPATGQPLVDQTPPPSLS